MKTEEQIRIKIYKEITNITENLSPMEFYRYHLPLFFTDGIEVCNDCEDVPLWLYEQNDINGYDLCIDNSRHIHRNLYDANLGKNTRGHNYIDVVLIDSKIRDKTIDDKEKIPWIKFTNDKSKSGKEFKLNKQYLKEF